MLFIWEAALAKHLLTILRSRFIVLNSRVLWQSTTAEMFTPDTTPSMLADRVPARPPIVALVLIPRQLPWVRLLMDLKVRHGPM